MLKQMMTMLNLQEQINRNIHPQWRTQQFSWYRAIWIESAELMEHCGWKWWKRQHFNKAQVTLEIVDIWHFGLSIILQQNQSAEFLVRNLEYALCSEKTDDLCNCIERFVSNTLQSPLLFDIEGFGHILVTIDTTFDELYCQYVSKNILNFFRQNHGYKEGTYKKIWQGKEDNEHLVELISTIDNSTDHFKDTLYKALETRYKQLA